jgi:hypothetical protein
MLFDQLIESLDEKFKILMRQLATHFYIQNSTVVLFSQVDWHNISNSVA